MDSKLRVKQVGVKEIKHAASHLKRMPSPALGINLHRSRIGYQRSGTFPGLPKHPPQTIISLIIKRMQSHQSFGLPTCFREIIESHYFRNFIVDNQGQWIICLSLHKGITFCNMFKRLIFIIALQAVILVSRGQTATDPTATRYSWNQCAGSLTPYPARTTITLPDSLKPVFIDHVGRHGARFPASAKYTVTIKQALLRADSLGTITTAGHRLLKLCDNVIEISHNNWGALDSLGRDEQRGIASRMFRNFPSLFNEGTVTAISSYAPRCVMSMYEFTHQLDRLNNHITITTVAGRVNSPLMRPFDTDEEYVEWSKSKPTASVYDSYLQQVVPDAPLKRVLGSSFPLPDDWRELALCEYYVLAGMGAMGREVDPSFYFTLDEYNSLWSCFNLRQYLNRTATTISTIPAEITSPLVADLIKTLQDAASGKTSATVNLRFGHAETLMPLLCQLHIPGCYYMTNYFDTVRQHWCDFYVVPMAANVQFVLLKADSQKHYLLTLLNEQPVTLIPGDPRTILPLDDAINYMTRCLPLHLQP